MPRKNKKNVAVNNNAASVFDEALEKKKKDNHKKLKVMLCRDIHNYMKKQINCPNDYLESMDNGVVFRRMLAPYISNGILNSLSKKQIAYSAEERKKIEQTDVYDLCAEQMGIQFASYFDTGTLKKNMLTAQTAFKGSMFTTRTIQMTMLRNALQDAIDENNMLEYQQNPGARDLENYMKKLKDLDASLDVYLSYKKEHCNGKTANARIEAAKKLKQSVKKSMLMLNVRIHAVKGEELTDAYMEVSAEERAQMLANRITRAYTQYPESRYRRMKEFAKKIQDNLSKDKNQIAPVDIKEQKAMLAAALVSEKDYSVWKDIQEKGYTVPAPGSHTAGKPGVREKMMQLAEQNEMLAKEDNVEVLLNMKPEEITKPIISILKAEHEAEKQANQPDPDFYELVGI